MALAPQKSIWNGTYGTFSLSVFRRSQEHLCRKRRAMPKVAAPQILREKAPLWTMMAKLAALVISWVIIDVARRYWWLSRQVVSVISRNYLSLMYLAYSSGPSSKSIWRQDIELSLGWGPTDMLVRAVLEWAQLVTMTLVALDPNYWGWLLTVRLARYIRHFSSHIMNTI